MNDNNDKDVHYLCENPVCLELIGYKKSHYFWIKSKPPCDTGSFLREMYGILEKICCQTPLSSLKLDNSQFFSFCDEDEVEINFRREIAGTSGQRWNEVRGDGRKLVVMEVGGDGRKSVVTEVGGNGVGGDGRMLVVMEGSQW